MQWLNYHHLQYFWMVAREGSIARAAAALRLTEPTVGAQIRELERALGEKLFAREGRALVLTDVGRVANDYATQIFTLGQELQATLGGVATTHPARLSVGIADVVPRLLAYRVLEPAVRRGNTFSIHCQNDSPERLLERLVAHEVDLVISDAPLHSTSKVSTRNWLLGDCGITIFGSPEIAARCRRGFPSSLDRQPFLFPAENSAPRRALEHWFASLAIRPEVRGEFTDSALMKTFGRAGVGAFAAPTVLRREVVREYGVRVIGRADEVRERYYATAASRRTQHPAVQAITDAARQRIFG